MRYESTYVYESKGLWWAAAGPLRLTEDGEVWLLRGKRFARLGSIEDTGLDYLVPETSRRDLAELLDEWRSSTSREDLHREWRRDYERGLL